MDNVITLTKDDECTIFGKPYACVNPKELLLIHFYDDIVELILEYFFDNQRKHILQLLSDLIFMINGKSNFTYYNVHIAWTIKNHQPIIYSFSYISSLYLSIIFKNNIEEVIVKQNGIEVTDEKIKYELSIKYLNELIIKEKTNQISLKNDIKLIRYGYDYLENFHYVPIIIRNILEKIINVLEKTNVDKQFTFNWFVTKTHKNDTIMRCIPYFITGKYNDTPFEITNCLCLQVAIYNISYRFGYKHSSDLDPCNLTVHNNIDWIMTNHDVNTVHNFLSSWIKQFE